MTMVRVIEEARQLVGTEIASRFEDLDRLAREEIVNGDEPMDEESARWAVKLIAGLTGDGKPKPSITASPSGNSHIQWGINGETEDYISIWVHANGGIHVFWRLNGKIQQVKTTVDNFVYGFRHGHGIWEPILRRLFNDPNQV